MVDHGLFGRFWLIFWVLWFIMMFGNVVVVVWWVWYRVFGWFSMVCHVNGGGSWCFAESMGFG